MLAYRGAREWARLHAPGIMLGVYSDDEMMAVADDRRARQARDVSPETTEDEDPPTPPLVASAPATQPEAIADEEPQVEHTMASLYEDSPKTGTVEWTDDEPPTPVAKKDPLDLTIPAELDRRPKGIAATPETDRLKGNLLRDIPTLDTADDFVIWARDAKDTIEKLPTADQTEVRAAFSARQEAVFKAGR
jgi:hypothetical protein